MLKKRVAWRKAATTWATLEMGRQDVVTVIRDLMKKRTAAYLHAVHDRLLRWTKPASRTPVRGALADVTTSKAALVAQNALLRQQLCMLRRQVTRPALTPRDRVVLVLLARLVGGWRSALLLVQPDTLLHWHRQGYRLVWRVRSATALARPQVASETVALIKRMAAENPLGGAERIRGELLKRGIRVGKGTVQRHMRATRPPRPCGQTWATSLHNHTRDVWACDFLPVVDLGFRSIFAFFMVEVGSRRVVHVGVTRHPTDAWVAQQRREATPFGTGPRFLIHDNDRKCGAPFARVAAGSRIELPRTPIRAPRANAICERFLGSVRRACLDHLLVLHEKQLYRVLRAYCTYFTTSRPHQGIGQAIPETMKTAEAPHAATSIVAVPVLDGLHHDYRRVA